MDFNAEFMVVSTEPVTEREAYAAVSAFVQDNNDLSGIYRIQIEEALRFLKRKLNVVENDSTAGFIEEGMRDLM